MGDLFNLIGATVNRVHGCPGEPSRPVHALHRTGRVSRIVAKEVLLGEGQTANILAAYGANQLAATQAKIAATGPGKDLLYRAITSVPAFLPSPKPVQSP